MSLRSSSGSFPGGPAELEGNLKAGDRIVGVGQGSDDAIVDVVGWRLDDVVDLIRGAKGTIVRLQIRPDPKSGASEAKLLAITRDQIKLEEQAAQKSVIEIQDGDLRHRIGVIDIPTFYVDFDARARGDENFRSTTSDVRRLITELEGDQIDALIIDLRGNGGGALSEATALTGLFIESGPVVQVRDARGRTRIHRDPENDLAYAGPLAVVVDRDSASASEIFAGAIQDYRRGIILGEDTFGKGTVQNLIDLRSICPGLKCAARAAESHDCTIFSGEWREHATPGCCPGHPNTVGSGHQRLRRAVA